MDPIKAAVAFNLPTYQRNTHSIVITHARTHALAHTQDVARTFDAPRYLAPHVRPLLIGARIRNARVYVCTCTCVRCSLTRGNSLMRMHQTRVNMTEDLQHSVGSLRMKKVRADRLANEYTIWEDHRGCDHG